MKKRRVTRWRCGTAEYVIAHAKYQKSRGKMPSENYFRAFGSGIEVNPKIALENAQRQMGCSVFLRPAQNYNEALALARYLVQLAGLINKRFVGYCSQIALVANPGDKPEKIAKEYWDKYSWRKQISHLIGILPRLSAEDLAEIHGWQICPSISGQELLDLATKTPGVVCGDSDIIDIVGELIKAYSAMEKKRKNDQAQAKINLLMSRLPNLDFNNLNEIIGWLEELEFPLDRIGVEKPWQRILEVFKGHGFKPYRGSIDLAKEDNQVAYATWLIRVALGNLSQEPHVFHRLYLEVREWKTKFGIVSPEPRA